MFDPDQLLSIAKSCGFLKRQRKVTPLSFVNSLMFHAFDKKEVSLNDHVIDLGKHEEVIMTKQSLHQRFNREAVDFTKQLVEKHCQTKLSDQHIREEILPNWNNVYLHDSCQFGMPDHINPYFKGYGGGINNNSIVKIQHCYELKTGKLHSHQVSDVRSQDVTSGKEMIDSYQPGDLVLRDLGYFDLVSFKLFDQKHMVDFISRLKPKTSIFELDGQKIDMGKLAHHMKKHQIPLIDKRVIIGTKKPVEVRIIMTLAPEQVKQERIRKTNKQNKSYGNHTSKAFKQYAAFNIFITNVREDILTADQIMKLYRVRWQIELVFKTWKSYYKVNRIKTCNCYRTLCYLYANLLLILINLEIGSCFQALGYMIKKKPLSILKLMKAGIQYKDRQRKWAMLPSKQIGEELEAMFANLAPHTIREERKYRWNYNQILELIN